MGSINQRTDGAATRFVYRVVVPYTYAGDPQAPDYAKANREPRSGVITTDIYRSRQQANGAATRQINRHARYRTHYGDGDPLYTFGARQMQRAELGWAVEQPVTWGPVA